MGGELHQREPAGVIFIVNRSSWTWCHAWLVDPATFFGNTFRWLTTQAKASRILAFMATLLIPITSAANMSMFLSSSALAIVISRFVPSWIAGYVYFGLALILTAFAAMYFTIMAPARFTGGSQDRNAGLGVNRRGLLNRIRVNLCFIPSLVLSLPLAIHGRPFSWNAMQFGAFLTVVYWTHLLWTAWFIGSSTTAIPHMVGTKDDTGTVASGQELKRVVLLMVLVAIITDLALTLVMTWLVGMERLPLLFKIAYFLLHGN